MSDIEFIISIKSSFNQSSLIVNKPYFVVIVMRVFMTFIKFIILIVRFVIAFPSLMFLKFIKMRIMREHLEYEIIQKIFNDYKNLIISNLRDLSFDFLIETFIVFVFLANYVNKFNIFKFIIYE